MGISSGKSTTKPVYNKQIEGAGSALTGVFNDTMPQIKEVSSSLAGTVPELLERFRAGDAGVNAAKAYNTDVLSGRYLDQGNPYLQGVIDNSNNDIRNQLQASLGARGLTGGSGYADVISRNIGNNTMALRYQDYGAERDRMTNAAGMAPGLAAADYIPLSAAMEAGSAASDPLRAAVGYSSGLGGLLGQYTQTKSKSPWGPMLAGALSGVASAFAGGG